MAKCKLVPTDPAPRANGEIFPLYFGADRLESRSSLTYASASRAKLCQISAGAFANASVTLTLMEAVFLGEKPDPNKKLRDVPHKPGVYLMKDRLKRVIYVGKARDLRKTAQPIFHALPPNDGRSEDARAAR